ncbi:jg2119, partial [Pararge aegeria aegeria]
MSLSQQVLAVQPSRFNMGSYQQNGTPHYPPPSGHYPSTSTWGYELFDRNPEIPETEGRPAVHSLYDYEN